jgi:osmotically-inducible protein OsmY
MLRKLRYMATGALIAYFFDPQNGRRRRALARDRIPAFFRTASKKAERVGGTATAQASAMKQKATHLKEEEKPQPDDVTLARKVETEIFRDADIPKGRINVNAENGKVVLRGEVEQPELIKDLEQRTKKVQGVQEVENLLHVPGTPAPTKS